MATDIVPMFAHFLFPPQWSRHLNFYKSLSILNFPLGIFCNNPNPIARSRDSERVVAVDWHLNGFEASALAPRTTMIAMKAISLQWVTAKGDILMLGWGTNLQQEILCAWSFCQTNNLNISQWCPPTSWRTCTIIYLRRLSPAQRSLVNPSLSIRLLPLLQRSA